MKHKRIPHGLIKKMADEAETSYGHMLNVLKGTRHAGYNLALTLAHLTETTLYIWLKGEDKKNNMANIKARKAAFLKLKLTTQPKKQKQKG